nr:acyl-CoA dehydrogenase family protein [Streptomyces sindenensis]
MHLAPTERQQRLRVVLRSHVRTLMGGGCGGGDEAAPGSEQRARQLPRRIGADGLLGRGRPRAYGGRGRGPDEQFVFFDEAYRAGAPVSMVTLNAVGPTLMVYGTEGQKASFLPRILGGDLVFAIGYSEPGAGRGLSALLRGGSPGCFGPDGELERMNCAARINTFGGGVGEVQREIAATAGLGMIRGKR